MARRNSPAEDLIEIAAKWPWWISVLIALLSYFVFGAIAENAGPVGSVFAKIAQVGLSLIFLFGALLSLLKSKKKNRLFDAQGNEKDLNDISWSEFEMLVEEVYRRKGFRSSQTAAGPDGGIDVVLSNSGLEYLVQCKQWKNRTVGVKVIRELAGVVKMRKAAGGIIVTSSQFTAEALREAKVAGIETMNGRELTSLIASIQQQGLMAPIGTAPDKISSTGTESPSTPTCPTCSQEMVLRTAKRGRNKGGQFWGCSAYPKCLGTQDF